MQFRIPTNLRAMGNMCDQISTSISLFLHCCCMYYSLVGSVSICFFHLPWSYVHQCLVAEFYPCSCSSHPSTRCQHQGPPTNFVYRALLIYTFFFEKGSFSDFKIVTSRQYINLKSSWPLLGRHTTLHKNANKRDTLMANGYQFEDHSTDGFLVDS